MLWIGAFLAFLCVAHGNLESTDSAITMQGARALWRRGDSGLLRSDDGAEWLAEGMLAAHIEQKAPFGFGKVGADGRHHYVWFPIGHVWLMTPLVGIGEWLLRCFPGVEADYHRHATDEWYHEGQQVFAQAAIALVQPAAVGATTILLLWLIARALGCRERPALLVAAATVVCTQCLATARETLSNGPGMVFLLGAVLAAVRCHLGTATRRTMVLGGMAAGAAVLCRYQQAAMLLPLLLCIALAVRRQRRWSLLTAFALGGAPFAIALLAVDQARFGNPFVTGYPPLLQWSFNLAPWIGLPRMLIAASKGVLWLSPLVWLVLPQGALRRHVPQLRWFAWAMLLLPALMFASVGGGWQSGQCWGSRYVTDGIVVFFAIVLAQGQPWQRWPRLFAALCALGLLVNLTAVVAPVRGHSQLAAQATMAFYENARARGEIGDSDLAAVNVDLSDHFYWEWRYSVLHANWRYAYMSLTGGFEDAQGRPRNGASTSIEPVFGVTSADPARVTAPAHWEDRNFRHLWWKFWGDLLGLPWWLLLAVPAVAAGAMLRAAWRRLS